MRLREQLASFEVVPEYKELEREANALTREIDAFNVDNVMDGDLLQQLRGSLSEEAAPTSAMSLTLCRGRRGPARHDPPPLR